MTYVPPENANGTMNVWKKSADVYSFGMLLYEILSNLSNPWEGVIQPLKDHFIIEALKKGTTPDIKILQNIYTADTSKCEIVISNCWNSNPLKRPSMEMVNIFFLEY